MNVLIDEAQGKPLPIPDATHRIACVLQYAANSKPEDGEESDDEAFGRQLVLDVCSAALEEIGKRTGKPAPVVASII